MRVDESEQISIPFEYCTRQGCRVEFELTADLQKSLEAGNFLQIGWRQADGNNAVLRFSLAGFKAAWGTIAGGP